MSAATGSGKGQTTTVQSSVAADKLVALAQQFAGETSGVRGGLIDAMNEVLKTGGSTVPIISRSVEQSRSAGSKAMQQTDERLALTGLAGTPEGERIRSEQALQSEVAAGQAQQALAQNIFGMIANFILGQSQSSVSGLSGAIPGTGAQRKDESAKAGSLGFSL